MGTLQKEEALGKTLAYYSIIAALKDSRFEPITVEELPALTCEISILTNFEVITANPFDWFIDTHGIEISFADSN